MKPLLDRLHFLPVFGPLVGYRVGLVHAAGTGNTGDRMIEHAAEQLLEHFGIQYRVQEPDGPWTNIDFILLFGGGNFGHPFCIAEAERRARALHSGLPCIVLPQTIYGREDPGFEVVWSRDITGLRIEIGSRLAPDLAMGWYPGIVSIGSPLDRIGLFLNTGPEGLFHETHQYCCDPRHAFSNPTEYVLGMASYQWVITDCLHAAIAALIARRRVTFLPTGLHKNRSIYDTWLRHLGCEWAWGPDAAIAK
jgi:exopolysaccharide biosynthesis predicted pyruvyltransferase EpsI